MTARTRTPATAGSAFIRTVKACDDLTVGSRIEVAFAPNDSSSVNRNDEDNGSLNSGDNFSMSAGLRCP